MRFDPPATLAAEVAATFAEDLGPGDRTTEAIVPPDAVGRARIRARQPMVVCGLPVARECFAQADARLCFEPQVSDGDEVGADAVLATLEGPLRGVLTGERLALNYLQRLSGVATYTRAFVQRLGERPVRLTCTRKTTPGLRSMEKYAVRVGGAHNHRYALYDGILIKDNHIAVAGSAGEAVRRARANAHHLFAILCEVESLEQAVEAAHAGARVLMLDNFGVDGLQRAVPQLRALGYELTLEASGGIDLDTVASVADTGVDVISSGALVHQARWVDISLDVLVG